MDIMNLTKAELDMMTEEQLRDMANKQIQAVIGRVIIDPAFFVLNYCYTLDTHDDVNPVKKFPDKEYIIKTIEIWKREPLLLVPKSRQMMASWLFIALHYWLAAYHEGKFVFFQSKKEEDADLLLDRAWFIHEHIPVWLRPDAKRSYCWINFKGINSKIQAVSQSSDAIRSQTASAIMSDEVAFQPYAGLAYAAAKPTIDGGGKWTGISTANFKEFFYNMCFDKER